MADILIPIEDLTTALASYDTIRLYRDTAPDGAFATVLDSQLLVAATYYYTFTDTSATADSYYRWSLYNSSTTDESAQSPVLSPFGNTLRRLRYEAAMACAATFRSSADAGSTTTTLIDATLADSAVDAFAENGAWIYRPDAGASGDRCRRISSYDTTTFAFSVARAWANAPAADETYEVYALMPPIDQPMSAWSWDRAVREGLKATWFVDTLYLGIGTTGGQRRYDLSTHAAYVHYSSIRRVFLRTTDSNSIIHDETVDPWLWAWVENTPGEISIDLSQAPTTDESVMIQVNRTDGDLYLDTDVTQAPFDRSILAITALAYKRLNGRIQPGKYGTEATEALDDWVASEHRSGPKPVVLGV